MWLVSWLPDMAFHAMLAAGIVLLVIGFAMGMLPFVDKYKLPLQLIGILLTVISIWFEGGIAKDKEYREQIAQMKVQVAESEKKAAEASGKTEIVYRDRVQKVTDTKIVIQEKIINMAEYLDGKCKVPTEAVHLHNQSAHRPEGVKK